MGKFTSAHSTPMHVTDNDKNLETPREYLIR